MYNWSMWVWAWGLSFPRLLFSDVYSSCQKAMRMHSLEYFVCQTVRKDIFPWNFFHRTFVPLTIVSQTFLPGLCFPDFCFPDFCFPNCCFPDFWFPKFCSPEFCSLALFFSSKLFSPQGFFQSLLGKKSPWKKVWTRKNSGLQIFF